jgi:hypothetical protein
MEQLKNPKHINLIATYSGNLIASLQTYFILLYFLRLNRVKLLLSCY